MIYREGKATYVFGDRQWNGQPACLRALSEEPDLCEAVMAELRRRDELGEFAEQDAAADDDEINAGTLE